MFNSHRAKYYMLMKQIGNVKSMLCCMNNYCSVKFLGGSKSAHSTVLEKLH